MMRTKDKEKLVGRFKKSFQSTATKKAIVLGVHTPNHNHIHKSQKNHFRSTKKKSTIDNNSSVISINTLIKSTNETKQPANVVKEEKGTKPMFLKKKNSGSILKRKKNKYEPSKLLDYYSRSSFQKV